MLGPGDVLVGKEAMGGDSREKANHQKPKPSLGKGYIFIFRWRASKEF